jgi:uncharacterized membrane protein YhaH (DUF805 family)
MDPQYAIRSVLSQYVGFSGRASRSEYWIWWGFMVVVFVAIGAVAALLSGWTGFIVSSLVALAFFLPNLAVTVRRLHDTGRSGLWVLIVLIPAIGGLILLILLLLDGQSESNKWGLPPYGSTYGPRTP